MTALATEFTAGVQATHRREPGALVGEPARRPGRVPVRRPAPRAPAASRPPPPTTTLDEYLHLYMANRGVLITPFHNMALMCPDTTPRTSTLHTRLFADAVAELVGDAAAMEV